MVFGLLVASVLLNIAPEIAAQEIRPFRIYRMGGYVLLSSLYEEDDARLVGERRIEENTNPVFLEEMNLSLYSYIYHPRFLKLDLGGGVLFTQERLATEGEDFSEDNLFYNGLVRLTLLERKPYPLTLYYRRRVPRIPLGRAGQIFVKDVEYGLEFRETVTFLPIFLELSHTTEDGSGGGQITDEALNRIDLETRKIFGEHTKIAMSYQFRSSDSASGSLSFPIQEKRQTIHSSHVTTRQRFGHEHPVEYRNFLRFYKQLEFPERQDIELRPELTWQLSDTLQGAGRISLTNSRVEGENITIESGNVALHHRLFQSLFTHLEGRGRATQAIEVTDLTYGGGGDVRYQKKLPFGNLSLASSLFYDFTRLESRRDEIPVFGEEIVLAGIEQVPLSHPDVVRTSIEVFNASRSRRYVEGLDYSVITVGATTSIQRRAEGEIADGERVLVDYTYAAKGTVSYSVLSRSYSGRLSLFSRLALFGRFRNMPIEIHSGTASQPLNSEREWSMGSEFHLPISIVTLNASVEYSAHDEEIAPFRQKNGQLSIEVSPSRQWFFVLSGSRTIVDYPFSPEDIDFLRGEFRFEAHPFPQWRIATEGRFEADRGGTFQPRLWQGRLQSEWQHQAFSLQGYATIEREEEEDRSVAQTYERVRFRTGITLRRTF
ncbi:MAG: hypothetical protein D6795_01370 [Deltaproteobacteria bacterium]|nr:MAG: hypothetical protein D6795_01370 [Deltaproteobacteria bacterium]